MRTPGKRLPLIDGLRGLLLLGMAGFHALWDLEFLFGAVDLSSWEWALHLWQQSVCWAFIFLSGFCWSLGRHGLRRGALVFLWGAAIMGATAWYDPDNAIYFGILTLLGSSMVLLVPLHPVLRRAPPAAGCTAAFLLFLASRHAAAGYLGWPAMALVLPDEWYRNHVTAFLGFPGEGFHSPDYFPLVPWFFLFLSGYFFYYLCANKGFLSCLAHPAPRWLTLPGRHSLLFYLVHQPVLVACFHLYFALA